MSKPFVSVHTETLQETIFGNDAIVTIHLVEVEQDPQDIIVNINLTIKEGSNVNRDHLISRYGVDIGNIIDRAIETAI